MKKPSLVTLFLLMPFASIAAVLFTPALPEIARLFQISESSASSSMTVFLLGYALGNLPYGPIAKRFGRKSAIYCGSGLMIVSSLLILVAGRYQWWGLFLVARFLSALGSSVGMKIAFTMIGDVFEKKAATKVVSIASLAFAIAPGLAVALGGFLTVAYGWESCFYALIGYSVGIIILSLFLPETAPYLDPLALNPKTIIKTYYEKLGNKRLIYSSLMLGCVTSVIYLFSTLAPFLAMNRLHFSPEVYGMMNCIPPIGMMAGSFFSHRLSASRSPLSIMALGTKISLAVSGALLILFLTGQVSIWTLFLPMPFMYIGTSLVFNNASSFAMEHVKDKSNGSAVMGFINMSLATTTVLITESLAAPSFLILPILFLLIIFGMFALQKRLTLSL